jgi:hypothetical protein
MATDQDAGNSGEVGGSNSSLLLPSQLASQIQLMLDFIAARPYHSVPESAVVRVADFLARSEQGQTASPDDVAMLWTIRSSLCRLVAPATPLSIAFTAMVNRTRLGIDVIENAFPGLKRSAKTYRRTVLAILCSLLIVTVLFSALVLFGLIGAQRLDQVQNRRLSAIGLEMQLQRFAQEGLINGTQPSVQHYCNSQENPEATKLCSQWLVVKEELRSDYQALQNWYCSWRTRGGEIGAAICTTNWAAGDPIFSPPAAALLEVRTLLLEPVAISSGLLAGLLGGLLVWYGIYNRNAKIGMLEPSSILRDCAEIFSSAVLGLIVALIMSGNRAADITGLEINRVASPFSTVAAFCAGYFGRVLLRFGDTLSQRTFAVLGPEKYNKTNSEFLTFRSEVTTAVQAAFLGPEVARYQGRARLEVKPAIESLNGFNCRISIQGISDRQDDWADLTIQGNHIDPVMFTIVVQSNIPDFEAREWTLPVPASNAEVQHLNFTVSAVPAGDWDIWAMFLQANRTVQVIEKRVSVSGQPFEDYFRTTLSPRNMV